MNSLLDGQYKLIKKIGYGGFGEVYEAKDMFNGKLCAIKIEIINQNINLLSYEANIY